MSIFYLPLAFCAVSFQYSRFESESAHDLFQALWAIPNITESSTQVPFIVAAVCVGFVTYCVVFNLDALISLGWTAYSGFRAKCIEHMMMSTDGKWRRRARSYRNFQSDHERTKISEWHIMLYALFHPFGRSGGSEETEEDGEEDGEGDSSLMIISIPSEAASVGDPKTPRGKAWKEWLRGLFRKSEKGEEKTESSSA